MLAGMLLLVASIATVETMYWQFRYATWPIWRWIEAARAGATRTATSGAIEERAFARAEAAHENVHSLR